MPLNDAPDWRAEGRRKSQDELRRRTIEHMRNKTTDLAAGPMKIDPAIYKDPARFELEKRALFRNSPILAGLTLDIPEPGDSMLIDILGPPILIVRTKEGEVKAYLNMCTHRAARLVTDCKRRTRMTCLFHGWTFDLNGQLIGLPGKEGFEGLEKSDLGLVPVPVAEWRGLIFVRAVPRGEPIDVAEWLGPMGDEIAYLEMEKAAPVMSSQIPADANWKYCYDTYGESYHFATLHRNTIGALAYSNMMTFQPKGRHTRLGFPRAEFDPYFQKPEQEWPSTDYGGLYMLFPNVSINVNSLPDGGQFYGISRVFPGDRHDRSLTLMTTYRPIHSHPELPNTKWEEMHKFIEKVVSTEDYSVSASGQANLEWAPADFRMNFGANEVVLQHHHRQMDEILKKSV